jgi:hypothetical protein
MFRKPKLVLDREQFDWWVKRLGVSDVAVPIEFPAIVFYTANFQEESANMVLTVKQARKILAKLEEEK